MGIGLPSLKKNRKIRVWIISLTHRKFLPVVDLTSVSMWLRNSFVMILCDFVTFQQNKIVTRLGCFYVTAILSWGWDWSWGWFELEVEVRLNWCWGWDEVKLKFSWSWVELGLSWVRMELSWVKLGWGWVEFGLSWDGVELSWGWVKLRLNLGHHLG